MPLNEAEEKRLKAEVMEALLWAIRSLEYGGEVEQTMLGFINRLQNGDEWFRKPEMEEEPSMDNCNICGDEFIEPLSPENMQEINKAKMTNKAVFPVRVCEGCYAKMDARSPYKASMN